MYKTGAQILLESITIENATFLYKTTLSKTNVKIHRMGIIKWNFQEEWSFATSNFTFFWKVDLFDWINKNLFNVQTTQIIIIILFISTWVLFDFWVTILKLPNLRNFFCIWKNMIIRIRTNITVSQNHR